MPKVIKGGEAEWGKCSRTVSLGSFTWALSYWNNTIAVGSEEGDIIILDAITGSKLAILSGHLQEVGCFTFSSDGRLLVSGSDDKTVKLWDVQTGGVVKTFYGHDKYIWSVSISADCTRIASGSADRTIRLWDIQTRECNCVMGQNIIEYVSFSPMNPQQIIYISDGEVWQWDVNGHQVTPTYNGSHITFSPDQTQFALCNGSVITIQNFGSRVTVAGFHVPNGYIECCCFSSDSRFIAAATGRTVYVWDINNPDSHPIETLVGHTEEITSLVFSSPSSLVSASKDKSVKFWQIGTLATDLITTDPGPTLSTPPPIYSISLQARTGTAISSDRKGMVKIWDISTGLCKASFQTPAEDYTWRDVQLIDDRLIVVWCKYGRIHIWDNNRGESLQTEDVPLYGLRDLRISGDGSKVFCLTIGSIQVLSIHTGKFVGEVELRPEENLYLDPLQMDDSRIWIRLEDSSTQGWDFGISDTSPVSLFNTSTERPYLGFIGSASWQTEGLSWAGDTVARKVGFRLPGRHVKPTGVRWDGRYLVAGYRSGEVLIVDFCHMCPQ